MKLVSVGSITRDYYPELDLTFVGGISYNFAIHARRCGAEEVTIISRLGQDEPALLARRKLAEAGINDRYVTNLPGLTGSIDIAFDEQGDRYFPAGSYHPNVLAGMTLTAAELAFVQTQDAYMTLYGQSSFRESFAQLATLPFAGLRAADFGDFSYHESDLPGLYAAMAQTDVAFISGQAADERRLPPLAASGETVVVLTHGATGSLARQGERRYQQPAIPVADVLDPTGCGDAFQAAFLVHYWRHRDLAAALHAGAHHATTVLHHYGAQ